MGGYFRPRTKSTESVNALCALFFALKIRRRLSSAAVGCKYIKIIL